MSRICLISGVFLTYLFYSSLITVHAEVVGHWTFDSENQLGTDASSFGNDGEPKANATWTSDGKVGGGLKLDGESWLEVPHDDSLNVTTEVTLMCWVKFDAVGDFYQSLIWKNGPQVVHYSLRLFRSGLKLRFGRDFGGFAFDGFTAEGRTITEPGDLDYPEANRWYHVAAVCDGEKVRLYTDGKEKGSADQMGNFVNSEAPLTIGFDLRTRLGVGSQGGKEFVRGIVDEVVVFNHALTQDEVQRAVEGVLFVSVEGTLATIVTIWADIKVRE
jgi:hypothetical protein